MPKNEKIPIALKWEDVVLTLAVVYNEAKTYEGRKAAADELLKLARYADAKNAEARKEAA